MVEITNRKELETWLKDRPREDAVLIAARAALRVFPLIAPVLEQEAEDRRAAIVLPSLRAIAVASLAGTWPRQATEVLGAARAAAGAAYPAADAAARAAEAAVADAYAAARAADAAYAAVAAVAAYAADAARAAYAADAAARAADATDATDATDAAYAAVASDATALEQGMDHAALAATPLWRDGAPDKITKLWEQFSDHLLAAPDDWHVWNEWYQDRWEGVPAIEEMELKIALIPNETWEAGPATLNAEVIRLQKEHRSNGKRPNKRLTPEEALRTDQLRAALTDFTYDQLEKMMRSIPFEDDLKDLEDPDQIRRRHNQLADLAQDAEELLEDMEASTANNPALLNALRRYRDEALKPIEMAQHRRLWFNYGAALNRASLDEYTMSSFGEPTAGNLKAFVEQHLNLFRDYLSVIAARTAAIDHLVLSDDVAPDQAMQIVDAIIEEVADPEDGPPADEQTIGAFRMDRDQLREMLRANELAYEESIKEKLRQDWLTRLKLFAVTAVRLKLRGIEAIGKGAIWAVEKGATIASALGGLERYFPQSHQRLMEIFPELLKIVLGRDG